VLYFTRNQRKTFAQHLQIVLQIFTLVTCKIKH